MLNYDGVEQEFGDGTTATGTYCETLVSYRYWAYDSRRLNDYPAPLNMYIFQRQIIELLLFNH
jgi:hypothetical protein